MNIKNIILFALLLTYQSVHAQDLSTQNIQINKDNYKEFIKSLPAFSMFGDNYFVTGTSVNKDAFKTETSDVKYEIGFKQRLTNVDLPGDIFPFVTYRQKSFWDLYAESLPFREHNYNPTIGFAKLFVNDEGITDGFWLSFEHESNGRDQEFSRSWNFLSLTYFKPIGDDWQLKTKVWIPIGEREGNEDITSYRGYFSAGAAYRAAKNIFIDVDIQPAYNDKLTGHIKTAVSFKFTDKTNQFLYIQYFRGYGEDLIDYNKFDSNLRLGMVFKDLFANFRQ